MAAAAAAAASRPCARKRKAPAICISSDDAEEDDESEDEQDEEEENETAAAAAAAASSSRSYKGKAPILCISSDDAEEDDESEDEEEEASECESDEEPASEEESDEYDCVSEDESGSCDDADDIDEDDHDDDDGDDLKVKPTDEDQCNKIINLLRGQKKLDTLKLEECKSYLRKHKLRIGGTKEMCFKRILEHWRIKDGNGKKLYSESSFVINCTGDVCRGDVVLFKQRVYEKFDIVKRGGGAKVIGKRVIAGRVVSESYGGSKQQHTFSIDVLWSEGVNPLPHLFPLLVKGRNLYRHKTFRQPWYNEAERSRVLAEKHNRGSAARHVRATAKAMAMNKGYKLKRKRSGTKAHPNKTKAHPNKKRRPDLELASRKQKKICARKSSNGHANTRKAAMTRKAGPSTTHSQAKRRKAGPSSTQVHAKSSAVAKTKNSNPSAILPQQPNHHANGIQRGYQYPQRYAHYNHNHPPAEVLHTNNIAIHQENRGMHHLPSHNMGYPSAAGGHHGHVHHLHNFGHPSSVHGQGPNMSGYYSNPYGNPSFQLDPRRRPAFDQMLPGAQFHGWRRP